MCNNFKDGSFHKFNLKDDYFSRKPMDKICHIFIFSDDIYDDILDLKIIKYKMKFTVLAVLTVLNHFLNVYILEETGAIIRGCSGVIIF